jgi:hypothetical protein
VENASIAGAEEVAGRETGAEVDAGVLAGLLVG